MQSRFYTDGYYFTFKDIRIFPEPEIVATYKAKLPDMQPFELVRTSLDEAVAGAGKTYRIIHDLSDKDSLVLTQSRKNCEELRNGIGDKCEVRTSSSYLMNPGVGKKKLIFDEALMMPRGAKLLCEWYCTGVETVIEVGDRPQIPFVNRSNHDAMHQSWTDSDYDEYVFCPESKRFGPDIARKVAKFYDCEVKTTSDVHDSTAVHYIPGIDYLPIFSDTQYVTMTQKDKSVVNGVLRERGLKPTAMTASELAATVHELQGGTFKAVIIVRLMNTAQFLWDNSSYQLVAITRASHATLFCTTDVQTPDNFREMCAERVPYEEVAHLVSDGVKIHSHNDCECGGDKHPLVAVVRAGNRLTLNENV
jgi:hypothetical protein